MEPNETSDLRAIEMAKTINHHIERLTRRISKIRRVNAVDEDESICSWVLFKDNVIVTLTNFDDVGRDDDVYYLAEDELTPNRLLLTPKHILTNKWFEDDELKKHPLVIKERKVRAKELAELEQQESSQIEVEERAELARLLKKYGQ